VVNRQVVGAHYGLRDWLAQRITAVVMVIYTILFLVAVIRAPQLDHAAWRAIFVPQWMKLASLLFMLCIFMHAWVGMRNIFDKRPPQVSLFGTGSPGVIGPVVATSQYDFLGRRMFVNVSRKF